MFDQMRSFAIYASAAALYTAGANPANAVQDDTRQKLSSVVIVNGTCESFSFRGRDASNRCDGKLINAAYKTGRSSFSFALTDLAIVLFSGADGPFRGNHATIKLDRLIFTLLGTEPKAHRIPATGACTYTNPDAGPVRVHCSASTKFGTFAGSFLGDGKEPEEALGQKVEAVPHDVPATSQNPPQTQCVLDRVSRLAKLDESARILAAQIADRCSEMIVLEHSDCGETQAYCNRIDAEGRAAMTATLERLAYQLLLLRRQSGSH